MAYNMHIANMHLRRIHEMRPYGCDVAAAILFNPPPAPELQVVDPNVIGVFRWVGEV